jgi:Putative adhesin
MNSRGRKIYSLLALALAGCVAGERHVSTVQKSWPSAQIKRVEVREVDGTINVHGGAADTVNLNATIRTYGKPKDDTFHADLEGDTLIIGRRQHHVRIGFFTGWNEPRIDYDLAVPSNVELKLSTVNGHIATRGVAGETAATTVNGSLDIETDGTKEVTAKSVNGRILCTFKKDFQGATFKTVNGRVIATLPPSASFYGDFTQVNGDFEAAFPLDIHSHPGSRRVSGEVNGGKYELKITTVNGDIKVETLGGLPVPPAPPLPPAPNVVPAPPVPPAPST